MRKCEEVYLLDGISFAIGYHHQRNGRSFGFMAMCESVVGERERGWCFHIGQCTVRTGVALESSLAMFS